MEKQKLQSREVEPSDREQQTGSKKTWQEPKLKFVEPKLTRHGELTEVTGQFFGAFSPPIPD